MSGFSVIEIPQWQGSSRPPSQARELAAGAALLADTVPAAPRRTVPVPETPGVPAVSGGGEVRELDVITEVAEAARAAVSDTGGLIVTLGGDCGVELAPVSAVSARHGTEVAVVWFDAHGDLNTPAPSPTRWPPPARGPSTCTSTSTSSTRRSSRR